jgi:cobalamin biosynthetic protein CobC
MDASARPSCRKRHALRRGGWLPVHPSSGFLRQNRADGQMDGQTKGIGGTPDHGGGIDAAAARHGGVRADWLDLSTGINPCPYPLPPLPADAWTALPDHGAVASLIEAARRFWNAPPGAAILAAPGASSLIARLPLLAARGRVAVPAPTYNEHARAFTLCGWDVAQDGAVTARVVVNPNNPDGRRWTEAQATAGLAPGDLLVIDESFADTCPEASLMALAERPGVIILKSFGKFWGLAGLRLGFAIGDRGLIASLSAMLGPWPVSGPALAIGSAALSDPVWTAETRRRLADDAARLDRLVTARGAKVLGGTDLFRLYRVPNAGHWQERLAAHRIWTRIFPYDPHWLRLGLPGTPTDWTRLEQAL